MRDRAREQARLLSLVRKLTSASMRASSSFSPRPGMAPRRVSTPDRSPMAASRRTLRPIKLPLPASPFGAAAREVRRRRIEIAHRGRGRVDRQVRQQGVDQRPARLRPHGFAEAPLVRGQRSGRIRIDRLERVRLDPGPLQLGSGSRSLGGHFRARRLGFGRSRGPTLGWLRQRHQPQRFVDRGRALLRPTGRRARHHDGAAQERPGEADGARRTRGRDACANEGTGHRV